LGADGYLVKPLNHLLLAGRIKRLLGRGGTEPAE
jgi:DNA-binding response OmpR family regulator